MLSVLFSIYENKWRLSVMPQYVLNTLLQVFQSNMINAVDYSPYLFSKCIL